MSRLDETRFQAANPVNQDAAIGDRLAATPIVVKVVVDSDVHTTAKTFTVPYDMYIVDVVVQCNALSSSGTVTVRTGTTAITDAIVCAANHVVTRAGSLDDAQTSLTAGTTYNVISHGAGDRGTIYITGMRY